MRIVVVKFGPVSGISDAPANDTVSEPVQDAGPLLPVCGVIVVALGGSLGGEVADAADPGCSGGQCHAVGVGIEAVGAGRAAPLCGVSLRRPALS